MGAPAILPTRIVAALLGVSRSTIHAWITTDPRWRSCIVKQSRRKYWLSRQRLEDIGALPRAEQKSPAIGFTYTTEAIA